MIYLDYSATTPLDPEVLKEMHRVLKDEFANPSSIHTMGRSSRLIIDTARETISKFINARPLEIVFTAGGTEADNLGIRGIVQEYKDRGRVVISSRAEHKAVQNTLKALEKRGEIELKFVNMLASGRIDMAHFAELISDDTMLVSLMHVNNELGTINPVQEIGNLCRKYNAIYHVDAVQSFGKLPLDLSVLPIDVISASAHKIYGPKGAGFTYVRKGIKASKVIDGGHQEFDLRAGTENVPAIAGFAKAVSICEAQMASDFARILELNTYFRARLVAEIPDIRINTPDSEFLPYILNVSFAGCDGESFVLNMDRKGVAISSGSACTTGSIEASTVIETLGVEDKYVSSAVRFSIGRHTTKDELDQVVDKAKEVATFLRDLFS